TLEQVIASVAVETIVTTQVGDCLPTAKRLLTNLAVKYIKHMVPKFSLPGSISFNDALDSGSRHELKKPELTPDDTAFLQYTGGTTGPAKGAVLTHGNMIANVAQARAWLGPWVKPGHELILTALPLYHVFALMANCLLF